MNQIVELVWIFFHVIEEVISVYICCGLSSTIDTRSIYRIQIIRCAYASADTAFTDLRISFVRPVWIITGNYLGQIFTYHVITYVYSSDGKNRFRQAACADNLFFNTTTGEYSSADNQRYMKSPIMTRTFIVIIPVQMFIPITSTEVRTVVRSKYDDCVIIYAFFF